MEHDMAGMDHSMHHDMGHMDHVMPGMADMAAATGFDYSLAMMAGFLGSGHCLGMCGALVSGYFMKNRGNRSYLPYIAYQLTRIFMYTLVGVSAAALGVVLVSSGMFGKIQSLLQIFIGMVVTKSALVLSG